VIYIFFVCADLLRGEMPAGDGEDKFKEESDDEDDDEEEVERGDDQDDNMTSAERLKEANRRNIARRPVEGHTATTKCCTGCLQDKVLDDYHMNNKLVGGRKAMCKSCVKSVARQRIKRKAGTFALLVHSFSLMTPSTCFYCCLSCQPHMTTGFTAFRH
jgi:hypothetical protein